MACARKLPARHWRMCVRAVGIVSVFPGVLGRQLGSDRLRSIRRLDGVLCASLRNDVDGAIGQLDALIRSSKVISIHVPLDEETTGLASGALLGIIKPGAILINTSRRNVDEGAAKSPGIGPPRRRMRARITTSLWGCRFSNLPDAAA